MPKRIALDAGLELPGWAYSGHGITEEWHITNGG
jgi:hypothetical protein